MDDESEIQRCRCEVHIEYQKRVEALEKAEAREDIFDGLVILLILVYPYLPALFRWLWHSQLNPFYKRCEQYYTADSSDTHSSPATTTECPILHRQTTVEFSQVNMSATYETERIDTDKQMDASCRKDSREETSV